MRTVPPCPGRRNRLHKRTWKTSRCADARLTQSGCMVRQQQPNEPMVLLLGNYPPDQQQSMQRFSAMMLDGLIARGIEAEVVAPRPVLGKIRLLGRFVQKWLGYIDKYVFFPWE